MIVFEAKVLDPTHLELSTPITTGRGQTVLVSVVEAGEDTVEREQWLAASAAALQHAYSDSEPEYLPSMVKETNAAFEK